MNEPLTLWDAIIVGAGPAGLSAAIYLGRSHRSTLLLHSTHSMAKWEKDVQNYLGFPDGIDGQDLLARGLAQALRFHVEVIQDTVQSTVMKQQFQELLTHNPDFVPNRPSARNPVMRNPVEPGDTIWVNERAAARYLDLGNSIYALMLRFFVQIYSMERRPVAPKKILLEGALTLMHGVAAVASLLSRMPANRERPDVTAGLSFDLNRHFSPLELSCEKKLLVERLEEIRDIAARLLPEKESDEHARVVLEIRENLGRIRGSLLA